MSDIVKNEDNIEVDISQFDNENCQKKADDFARIVGFLIFQVTIPNELLFNN